MRNWTHMKQVRENAMRSRSLVDLYTSHYCISFHYSQFLSLMASFPLGQKLISRTFSLSTHLSFTTCLPQRMAVVSHYLDFVFIVRIHSTSLPQLFQRHTFLQHLTLAHHSRHSNAFAAFPSYRLFFLLLQLQSFGFVLFSFYLYSAFEYYFYTVFIIIRII